MTPYPLELRQRIVAAVDQQSHTIEEIATLFGVSERYVYQLLKLRRETGDLAPLPHGGGANAKLDEPKPLQLPQYLAQQPHIAKASGVSDEIVKKVQSILGWPATREQIH